MVRPATFCNCRNTRHECIPVYRICDTGACRYDCPFTYHEGITCRAVDYGNSNPQEHVPLNPYVTGDVDAGRQCRKIIYPDVVTDRTTDIDLHMAPHNDIRCDHRAGANYGSVANDDPWGQDGLRMNQTHGSEAKFLALPDSPLSIDATADGGYISGLRMRRKRFNVAYRDIVNRICCFPLTIHEECNLDFTSIDFPGKPCRFPSRTSSPEYIQRFKP